MSRSAYRTSHELEMIRLLPLTAMADSSLGERTTCGFPEPLARELANDCCDVIDLVKHLRRGTREIESDDTQHSI